MNYKAQLAWLFTRQRFGMKPGLKRIRSLLTGLGNPDGQFKTILIGGSNGKGSTASSLASILHASGQSTGLFTSPHLSYFRERFLVGASPLEEEKIHVALSQVRPLAEELGASFFEIVTALACHLFAGECVNYAVMEVGIGGRLDATNALDPELSMITTVSLEHTHILGDSVEEIALEKAGIMRPGRLCLTGAEDVLSVLQLEAQARKTQLVPVLHNSNDNISYTLEASSWQGIELIVQSPWARQRLHSPLVGEHQAVNVALAVAAAQYYGISAEHIQQGLDETEWPGRLERLSYKQRFIVLDGAHNPAGAKALAKALKALELEKMYLVFGMNQNKDSINSLSSLWDLAKGLILTQAQLNPKVAQAASLKKGLPEEVKAKTNVVSNPQKALEAAIEKSQPGETIVVAGSLYLIGEIRPYLLGEDPETFERWQ